MTINSTIDLSNYLLNQCGFSYILTAKMNQDCLEVCTIYSYSLFIYLIIFIFILWTLEHILLTFQRFFGIIRQVNGPNDHPSSTSFMQLYRLLSVYSLVKPPKTGNCTILEGIQNPLSTVDVSMSTISYKVLSIN